MILVTVIDVNFYVNTDIWAQETYLSTPMAPGGNMDGNWSLIGYFKKRFAKARRMCP
jgi:hypothetical protein